MMKQPIIPKTRQLKVSSWSFDEYSVIGIQGPMISDVFDDYNSTHKCVEYNVCCSFQYVKQMQAWCEERFGPGDPKFDPIFGPYDPILQRWYLIDDIFVFQRSADRDWFIMRWSNE